MSIGMYDGDVHRFGSVPFNLELMKLSSYYKKRREIVILSPTFSPEKYSRFIYRRDYYDGYFNKEILNYPNVEFGGLAFSNYRLRPLDMEIEKVKPDTSLYDNYAHLYQLENDFFNFMRKSNHFRLSLDDNTLWPNFEKQLGNDTNIQGLFLHDYNLGKIKEAPEIVEEILQTRCAPRAKVGSKFPIDITDPTILVKWMDLPYRKSSTSFIFNGFIPDTLFKQLIDSHESERLSLKINITHSLTSGEVLENLHKIFYQAVYACTKYSRFSLIYDEDFFSNSEWEFFIYLLNLFLNQTTKKVETNYFSFVKKLAYHSYGPDGDNRKFRARIKGNLRFIAEENYELFKDFYECKKVRLEGGSFRND